MRSAARAPNFPLNAHTDDVNGLNNAKESRRGCC